MPIFDPDERLRSSATLPFRAIGAAMQCLREIPQTTDRSDRTEWKAWIDWTDRENMIDIKS